MFFVIVVVDIGFVVVGVDVDSGGVSIGSVVVVGMIDMVIADSGVGADDVISGGIVGVSDDVDVDGVVVVVSGFVGVVVGVGVVAVRDVVLWWLLSLVCVMFLVVFVLLMVLMLLLLLFLLLVLHDSVAYRWCCCCCDWCYCN